MKSVLVGDVVVAVNDSAAHGLLSDFVETHARSNLDGSEHASVFLHAEHGIRLTWETDDQTLKFFIDVEKFTSQLWSFPSAKQGPFNQAMGKKTRTILDATGGWGSDALRLCSQGYTVIVVEQNPIMALLLRDAMCRLGQTEWARKNNVLIPTVVEADASDYLAHLKMPHDCIYLDPMYPPKRKKSAIANKNMQFLQWLLKPDLDSLPLLKAALDSNSRVVVKRPIYADPLLASPQQRFSSKLVHYDVYLPR